MASRVPGLIIAVIVVQAVFAGLFFYVAYGFSVSDARGGPAPIEDIVFLAVPMAIVAACGATAWWQFRAGRPRLAKALAWAPVPATISFFILLYVVLLVFGLGRMGG